MKLFFDILHFYSLFAVKEAYCLPIAMPFPCHLCLSNVSPNAHSYVCSGYARHIATLHCRRSF